MLFVGIDLGTYLCRFILAKQINSPIISGQKSRAGKNISINLSRKMNKKMPINDKYNAHFEVLDYKTAVVNFGVMEPGKFVMNATLDRIDRIFEKLSEYIHQLEEPVEIRCVATAALRYAPQADKIIENIYRKFNIKVEVIDSEHEIYLAALGCRDYIEKEALILDVGSGSTEIAHIICENGKIIINDYISLNLGLINNATTSEIRQEAFDMIKNFVKPYRQLPIICSKCNTLKIAYNYFHKKQDNSVDGKYFKMNNLLSITKSFNRMNTEALAKIQMIGTRKTRLIKSGLPWVCAVLKNLDIDGIILSESGLKEGIILDMIEKYNKNNLCSGENKTLQDLNNPNLSTQNSSYKASNFHFKKAKNYKKDHSKPSYSKKEHVKK